MMNWIRRLINFFFPFLCCKEPDVQHPEILEGKLTVTKGRDCIDLSLHRKEAPYAVEVHFEHEEPPPCDPHHHHHKHDHLTWDLVDHCHRYSLAIAWDVHSPARTILWKVKY